MIQFADSEPGRCSGLTTWQDLVQRIEALGVPYGREASFKLAPGRLLRDRLLIGVQRAALPDDALFALCAQLGMPQPGRELLAAQLPHANAVFFATEESAQACMVKVYLEFWDEVRRRVRAGDATPQLLHLGVKWSSARPDHHEEARYLCHPLLGLRDILRRMRALDPPQGAAAGGIARAIVRDAAKRAPQANFLYMEVSEADNARRSFDVNLYKSGLLVADAAHRIQSAAAQFGIAAPELDSVLRPLGPLPLGHVAGGCDRRGAEFLSIYAEVAPLPDPAPAQ